VLDPEFWLLETAFPGLIPLRHLVKPEVEYRFNKTSHGLQAPEMSAVLERLVWEGKIEIKGGGRRPALYSAAELERLLLDPAEQVFYGLTPRGGVRWEELTLPDWTRYVEDWCYSSSDEGPDRYEIIGVDRTLLERFVHLYFRWGGSQIVPGSGTWDVVAPWQVTGWKVLPLAWRFRATEAPGPYQPCDWTYWEMREFDRLQRWCHHSTE
jgi:hypothetical protein